MIRALERYAATKAPPGERCELCRAPIAPAHGHVADLQQRKLCCACGPCSLLFVRPEAGANRYRTVPTRVTPLDLQLDEESWATLGIPVRLAFVFFQSSLGRWVALYPSPAGAIEAEVEEEAWRARLGGQQLEPDVEAVLIHGGRSGGPFRAYVVPIDVCYDLVARIRSTWQGFDGGPAARRAIDELFAELAKRGRR